MFENSLNFNFIASQECTISRIPVPILFVICAIYFSIPMYTRGPQRIALETVSHKRLSSSPT